MKSSNNTIDSLCMHSQDASPQGSDSDRSIGWLVSTVDNDDSILHTLGAYVNMGAAGRKDAHISLRCKQKSSMTTMISHRSCSTSFWNQIGV